MGSFDPRTGPHPIHTVHRVAAGGIGGFLLVFGVMSAALSDEFVSRTGPAVMGLVTNGLLATLSLLTGLVLIAGALLNGPVASTVSVVCGSLFFVSGIGHTLIMNSALNILAFHTTNVVFSLVVGATLLILGSYGRFTGSLPPDSPYARSTTPTTGDLHHTPTDPTAERAMAAAERAVALHCATVDQTLRVRAASAHRTHDRRLEAFTSPSDRDRLRS